MAIDVGGQELALDPDSLASGANQLEHLASQLPANPVPPVLQRHLRVDQHEGPPGLPVGDEPGELPVESGLEAVSARLIGGCVR